MTSTKCGRLRGRSQSRTAASLLHIQIHQILAGIFPSKCAEKRDRSLSYTSAMKNMSQNRLFLTLSSSHNPWQVRRTRFLSPTISFVYDSQSAFIWKRLVLVPSVSFVGSISFPISNRLSKEGVYYIAVSTNASRRCNATNPPWKILIPLFTHNIRTTGSSFNFISCKWIELAGLTREILGNSCK